MTPRDLSLILVCKYSKRKDDLDVLEIQVLVMKIFMLWFILNLICFVFIFFLHYVLRLNGFLMQMDYCNLKYF